MAEVSEAVVNEHQSTFTFAQDDHKTNPENVPVSIMEEINAPKQQPPPTERQNINSEESPSSHKEEKGEEGGE